LFKRLILLENFKISPNEDFSFHRESVDKMHIKKTALQLRDKWFIFVYMRNKECHHSLPGQFCCVKVFFPRNRECIDLSSSFYFPAKQRSLKLLFSIFIDGKEKRKVVLLD
jgi:hypothetical protein